MPKPYPRPPIYTCEQWGAVPSKAASPTGKCSKWLLHQTADQNTKSTGDLHVEKQWAFELARRIQREHMVTNGWNDTGNQFTVSRGGIILEGRHGSIEAVKNGLHVIGAECEGYNVQSGGTEHEGIFDTYQMPDVMWWASVHLHAWIVDRDAIQSEDIDGHRDHIATDCPGAWFYAQLNKFREDVHNELDSWRKKNP